jgi:hypothetical protein
VKGRSSLSLVRAVIVRGGRRVGFHKSQFGLLALRVVRQKTLCISYRQIGSQLKKDFESKRNMKKIVQDSRLFARHCVHSFHSEARTSARRLPWRRSRWPPLEVQWTLHC